jgi:hypothetical protein
VKAFRSPIGGHARETLKVFLHPSPLLKGEGLAGIVESTIPNVPILSIPKEKS